MYTCQYEGCQMGQSNGAMLKEVTMHTSEVSLIEVLLYIDHRILENCNQTANKQNTRPVTHL